MNEMTVIVNSLKTFCTVMLRSGVINILICLIEINFVPVDDDDDDDDYDVVVDVVIVVVFVVVGVVILVVVNVVKTLTLSKYI